MAITSPDLVAEVQTMLTEVSGGLPAWISGQWNDLEVWNLLKRKFAQFLKDSEIVTDRSLIGVTPEVPRAPLPETWILNLRVAWRLQTDDANHFTELSRSDTWEMDHNDPAVNYNPGTPRFYTTGELPPPEILLFPPTDLPGEVSLNYVRLPPGYDPETSNFDPLPDEFVTYVKWGLLADMLTKIGRGADARRGAHCQQRYNEGVSLAKMILRGGS